MHVAATSSYLNSVNFQSAQRLQARSAASSSSSSQTGGTTIETEGLVSRLPDASLDQKLADYSKIQSAFVAAIKTGQSIEDMDLFASIQ